MILVAGSTGLLGSEICRLLSEDGMPVKALVRNSSDAAKRETLENFGLSLVYGDLKDKTSLHEACKGVHTVISTASSTLSRQEGDTIESVDKQGQMNLIDIAKKEGVKRFIFISVIDSSNINFPLAEAKIKVEDYLTKSGMNYTVLRSNWFMEVWLGEALGFDVKNATARIYGAGYNKLSWISYFDVAKLTVQSIENQKVYNTIINVGGPKALSPLEVIAIFERIGGRKFKIENVSEITLHSQYKNAPDPLQASFAALMLLYAAGVETSTDFLKYYNINLKTVEAYAEQMLAPAHA